MTFIGSPHFWPMVCPPTIVLRHKKENLKKCSLKGLEQREDFRFFSFPSPFLEKELESFPLENYVLLHLDGQELSQSDNKQGLMMIDATWRYAQEGESKLKPLLDKMQKRSLPAGFRTAYPRYQTGCHDPERGLASIEALYAAYHVMGRDTKGLLDNYYWKEAFLDLNALNLRKY